MKSEVTEKKGGDKKRRTKREEENKEAKEYIQTERFEKNQKKEVDEGEKEKDACGM